MLDRRRTFSKGPKPAPASNWITPRRNCHVPVSRDLFFTHAALQRRPVTTRIVRGAVRTATRRHHSYGARPVFDRFFQRFLTSRNGSLGAGPLFRDEDLTSLNHIIEGGTHFFCFLDQVLLLSFCIVFQFPAGFLTRPVGQDNSGEGADYRSTEKRKEKRCSAILAI